jgi:dihydroorotase
MLVLLKNFRIVDETTDIRGSVLVEDGVIREVWDDKKRSIDDSRATLVINGDGLVLLPAFVDLHAHFREPGFPEKEVVESASLAAAAGGYGTVVCMANTKPVTDTIAKAMALKNRADALGLIDLYPVLSLTKNMEGKTLSEITKLNTGGKAGSGEQQPANFIRLLSEDGKDVIDENLFLAAFAEARRIGIPISCHCDLKDENAATSRAIELAAKAGARIHIAHVSTKKAITFIKNKKAEAGKTLSCEVTPHHIALTEKDAAALGADTFGKVAPPLRSEEDRQALITAIADGTVDAIATDHAPHTTNDKAAGAPGFTGLETAFSVCYSTLVAAGFINLSKLSSLMSAAPGRLLGLDSGSEGRGRIAPGLRADFCIVDLGARRNVESCRFKSRGKNSPFDGRELEGAVVMTIHGGRVVFDGCKATQDV